MVFAGNEVSSVAKDNLAARNLLSISILSMLKMQLRQKNLYETNHARRNLTFTCKITPHVNYFIHKVSLFH